MPWPARHRAAGRTEFLESRRGIRMRIWSPKQNPRPWGLPRFAKWNDAVRQFSEVVSMNPADKAARLYVERCRYLTEHPPGNDWNGVWVMESKSEAVSELPKRRVN